MSRHDPIGPKAVILAGGRGTRLAEETDRLPKPLLEIGGQPILWHIMKLYEHHGINDFVICAGYKAPMVRQFFLDYARINSDLMVDFAAGTAEVLKPPPERWRVAVIDTGPDTQTGGRLKRIAPYVAGAPFFCATYGDSLTNVDVAASIAFHRAHGRPATMSVITPRGRFGKVEVEGGRILRYEEKSKTPDLRLNGGFFVLSPKVLDYIAGDDTVWEKEPLERLAREGELAAWNHDGYWQPMDTLQERRHLQTLWDQNQAPWKAWS